jgi:hypothetical protein
VSWDASNLFILDWASCSVAWQCMRAETRAGAQRWPCRLLLPLGKSATAASSSSATGPAASTGDGGHRAVEHGLSGACRRLPAWPRQAVDDGLLQYLSPLGWEHINLTGDYLWRSSAKVGAGKFRLHRCHRLSVLYLMRWSLLLPGTMLRTGFHSENHHGKHCAHWYRSG